MLPKQKLPFPSLSLVSFSKNYPLSVFFDFKAQNDRVKVRLTGKLHYTLITQRKAPFSARFQSNPASSSFGFLCVFFSVCVFLHPTNFNHTKTLILNTLNTSQLRVLIHSTVTGIVVKKIDHYLAMLTVFSL